MICHAFKLFLNPMTTSKLSENPIVQLPYDAFSGLQSMLYLYVTALTVVLCCIL